MWLFAQNLKKKQWHFSFFRRFRSFYKNESFFIVNNLFGEGNIFSWKTPLAEPGGEHAVQDAFVHGSSRFLVCKLLVGGKEEDKTIFSNVHF